MNLLHTTQTNLKQRVRRAGHGWMMLGCVAMVAIAIVLVATGVAGVGVGFAAVMCAAMMAMMMTMMGGMGSRNGGEHR
jgi:drug/metabolite transporter (DMT)-like permease